MADAQASEHVSLQLGEIEMLPPGWRSSNRDGVHYYYNKHTCETTTTVPTRPAAKLAKGWATAVNQEDGRTYYYNKKTRETSRFPPVGGEEDSWKYPTSVGIMMAVVHISAWILAVVFSFMTYARFREALGQDGSFPQVKLSLISGCLCVASLSLGAVLHLSVVMEWEDYGPFFNVVLQMSTNVTSLFSAGTLAVSALSEHRAFVMGALAATFTGLASAMLRSFLVDFSAGATALRVALKSVDTAGTAHPPHSRPTSERPTSERS